MRKHGLELRGRAVILGALLGCVGATALALGVASGQDSPPESTIEVPPPGELAPVEVPGGGKGEAVEDAPYAKINSEPPPQAWLDHCREQGGPEASSAVQEGCAIAEAEAAGKLPPGEYSKAELDAALAEAEEGDR